MNAEDIQVVSALAQRLKALNDFVSVAQNPKQGTQGTISVKIERKEAEPWQGTPSHALSAHPTFHLPVFVQFVHIEIGRVRDEMRGLGVEFPGESV